MAPNERHTILIVDDDLQIRKLLGMILKRAGYGFMEAENGLEAIRLFSRHRVDLVITDLIMPEKEGIETIVEMMRQRPTIPIIAISGGGKLNPKTYLKIAENLGTVETMVKPIDTGRLVAKINTLLADPPIGTKAG